MECEEPNVRQSSDNKTEVEDKDSSDKFQKFVYELFDKNGILNDLRAYLRGHIVNVLKSAQTGEPPLCQKHFTQRLELVSQALNILIAEYLLQLDFTYTLSVFVSEIPLSNMVFDFAKALLKDNTVVPNLRFQDSDVWSVLNYIGVKCDSEHASNIVEMYKSEARVPLLFCILKCIPMYRKESVATDEENSSHDSITSSANSLETLGKTGKIHRNISCHQHCKHFTFCKSCQNRVSRLKEKYRARKRQVHEVFKKSNENPLNVENFMKNINVMEKRIINEMFEQLHSVYEAEVELVRREEESRVRRTLASHALQLQQRRDEIEESWKKKKAELESNAHNKKQFLWGVARALREQHEHVTRAMSLLKDEQQMLAEKENNLKTQILQAEETLRRKGDEMRVQIAKELEILEAHLESMRIERESLNKERSDLEYLKSLCDSKTKIIEANREKEKEDLKQHYEVLKDEIAVLKKYIESTKADPKCGIEKSTITEFVEVSPNTSMLNNTNCFEKIPKSDVNDREVRPPNQLVNDLKKQKNVNFSQTHLDEMYNELHREKSLCSVSSEEAVVDTCERDSTQQQDTIQRLIEENESLKDYTRQQREHISALWSERARTAHVPRPRTAPALLPAANYFTVHRVNPSSSANTFGWRKGAGEELSLFSAEPPILLPGDPIPFVGIVRDRHADNRRHLINQWRALKRRSSPLTGINKVRPPIPIQRDRMQHGAKTPVEIATNGVPTVRIADDPQTNHRLKDGTRQAVNYQHQETAPISKTKAREKSPKTVLKEAKENLRNKKSIKEKAPLQKRDKSPNSMLREAKLRLRKLEIEAEAVEKSYLDFRKRQAELREERKSLSMLEDNLDTDTVRNLDISRSRSFQEFSEKKRTDIIETLNDTNDVTKTDKYFHDYQTKFDIGEIHFKNKNTAREKAKPIPMAYSEIKPKKEKSKNIDYLETTMLEFRKLYHAEKERNVCQLRSNIAENSDTTKMCNDDKKEINKISKVTYKEEEQEAINGRIILQDKHKIINVTQSRNTNNDEVNIVQTISLNESKIPIYGSEFDNKLKINDESIVERAIHYKNLETLDKMNSNKAVELEILKQNINKIYNFSPPTSSLKECPEDLPTHVSMSHKGGISNKIENLNSDNKNILRVEVESTYEVNKLKMSESQEGELVIFVQSSANTKESDELEENIECLPMTINLSPKRLGTGPKNRNIDIIEAPEPISHLPENTAKLTPKSRSLSPKKIAQFTPKSRSNSPENIAQLTPKSRSDSPEKAAQLTRNDVLNAIFHANDNKNVSSIDIHLDLSKEDISDTEKDPGDDYPDDFSADVDNYNSPSEYGNNSPISLPKSDNDNFWDN